MGDRVTVYSPKRWVAGLLYIVPKGGWQGYCIWPQKVGDRVTVYGPKRWVTVLLFMAPKGG